MRYRQKVNYLWSPPIAYSVGLIASDGCLQSDGRHIDLTSTDIDQLRCFSRAIGKDLRITLKKNSSATPAYRVQFSDVAYYDFLVSVGLTSKKSKTISNLKIPDEFYSHFLRGVFDGDGSTYGYYDPRWPKSYLYYVAFSGASINFLNYISAANKRLFGVKGSSIRKGARVFSLVYGKGDSYLLFNQMYRDDSDFYLLRKKNKLEGFIKDDNNATILRLNARVVKSVNTPA